MKIIKTALFIWVLVLGSCNDPLEEETFSVLGPSNFYSTGEDAEALLNGVYAQSQGYRDLLRDLLTFNEVNTDIMIERGGAINSNMLPMEDFLFPSTQPWLLNRWNRSYNAIYRANVTLEKVPGIDMGEGRKAQVLAEARFLRAFNYQLLYSLFGRVPLITNSETSVTDRPSRASEEEMINFLETEFLAVAAILPVSSEQFGRATKGAALGFLSKFYLNRKRWAEAAATAKQVMDLGTYALFTEGSREQLFAMDNEHNSEYIFAAPYPDPPTNADGNTYLSHAAPPGYLFEYPPKVNFAAQFKIRSEFLELFEPEDERLNAFVFEYTNVQGATVVLGED
ncbi:RagB/SusD family nutrient uptake outer membrane protein, partial [Arenibacter sp. ARW7G5Y1]|uniref:RagB/SusD family nutrient uptake outer membrane protein n=1 Tax=Arenibacter sp. ARW7G5Y1 TaxID=2135619 RepID=UPI000D76E885